MGWNVSGQLIEFCSCKILCPCWLGPTTEPDQGWCSGAIVYDINQGQIEEIDVGGIKVVFAADWPGNFFRGMVRHASTSTHWPVQTSGGRWRRSSGDVRAVC